MAGRKINPILKQVLELGPTILFFLIYMRIKDQTFMFGGTEYSGFIVAALILIPLLLVATLSLWLLTGTVSRMQIFVGVMVVFFGGLTAWFNDATFFKMKTTFVYGTFAVILTMKRGGVALEGVSFHYPTEPPRAEASDAGAEADAGTASVLHRVLAAHGLCDVAHRRALKALNTEQACGGVQDLRQAAVGVGSARPRPLPLPRAAARHARCPLPGRDRGKPIHQEVEHASPVTRGQCHLAGTHAVSHRQHAGYTACANRSPRASRQAPSGSSW